MSTHHPHIPNWETVKLGEVTEIIKGGTPSRNVEKYFRGNIAWAIPSDITALDSFLYIDDTETHITEEALSNSAARLLPVGTVLLTSRATIGETAITTVPMATNQGFANFVCRKKLLNVFLAYYLRYIKGKLNDLASGSTFKEVTKGTLLNIEIPCLPLEEQRAIAEVLSDVDGLINALEALIAKKQAIKQATMQQLLTGKTRLPGFSRAWVTKQIGKLIHLIPSGIYGLETQTGQLIGMPVATTAHIDPDDRWNQKKMDIRYFTEQQIAHYSPLEGDLIVVKSSGSAASIQSGKIGYVSTDRSQSFVFSNFLMLLRSIDCNPQFLFFQLTSGRVKQILPQLVEASTYPNLLINDYLEIQIPLPTKKEQSAIVKVLSDMDAEIAALEQRRDKTRAIKQGMMQQLLTGRVRLSESRICTDDTD